MMALLVPISIICEQQHLLIRYSFLGIIGILPRSPIMSSCVYNLWVYLSAIVILKWLSMICYQKKPCLCL